jgi:hypothetical protein
MVNGTPLTRDALRAVAHLGGIGGMNRFIETGGAYNPSDAYGTSLMDYAVRHGSGGGPAPSTAAPQNALAGMQQSPSQEDNALQQLSMFQQSQTSNALDPRDFMRSTAPVQLMPIPGAY